MSINFETAAAMQRICTGETIELTRGQIAEETIELGKLTEKFSPEKTEKCRAFYDKLTADDTKKSYDAESLIEEVDSIKREFDGFIDSIDDRGSFSEIFYSISDFFMNPPFEGMDGIEYGVNEVCVFSVVEYFMWKTAADHDHERLREEYRSSIADRTYEEVADHWIKVYDDLQRRYDMLEDEAGEERAFEHKLAGCCIIAISAIREQDEFSLDMTQSGAVTKGRNIADSYLDGTYKEDESAFADNVVRLYEFVMRCIA